MKATRDLSLLVYILGILVTNSEGSIRSFVSTAWDKFWSVSCEYTTVVSRTKRSTELPNLKDVEDVFQYLYPSATVQVAEVIQHQVDGSGRSDIPAFSKRSFSTWIDHVIDLWETQCKSRGSKRNQEDEELVDEDSIDKEGVDKKAVDEDPVEKVLEEVGTNVTIGTEFRNKTGRQPGPPGINDWIPAQLPTLFPTFLPTLIPTLPLPTPSSLATKTKDTFFSAYGGDIEYFIPLISFGIPFDGEITVLGFHGFKGLFPYR